MIPIISVIMPVYNAARYLSAAIESVRKQTISNWELLCVNDGSTDESVEIVEKFGAVDSRVRLVACPHRGIVDTLNHGVELCRGEFIARLDADDLALPDRFQLQIGYLQKNPMLAMIGGGYQTIDSNNRVWKTQCPHSDPRKIFDRLQQSNCIAHSSVMFRREALQQFIGPYRSHFPYAEDYDLWLRMAAVCEIGCCPEIVLEYRRDLSDLKPERIVQQTLSTLGAQWSNRCRLNKAADLAAEWTQLDESTLLNEGVSRSILHASIRRVLLSEARLAGKHGFKTQAARLVEFASRYRPVNEGLWPHLDFQWRKARASFSR